ncbi:hypothetical protein AJ80_09314 [Polytolypa hystricis UAMH7299]|uniref:Uncharacterized protein n=1 Tax=Polytolypa hystricis (strain UAMH7299) TaxID=1447883 RepID=A0A2B7WTA5_POLH7|nr:hypothetical protein AJ80_09314 [Polytolypa hystricis UAMH7299]
MSEHSEASDLQKADSNVVNTMLSSRDRPNRPDEFSYCPAVSSGGELHSYGAPVTRETEETKQQNPQGACFSIHAPINSPPSREEVLEVKKTSNIADHQISQSPATMALIPLEVDYESASRKADQKRFKSSIASRNFRHRKKEAEMKKKVEVSKSSPACTYAYGSETPLQPPRTSPLPPPPYYRGAPVNETGETKQQDPQATRCPIHALINPSPSQEDAPKIKKTSNVTVYRSSPSPAAVTSDSDLGLAPVTVGHEKAKRRRLNKAEMKWSLKEEDRASIYKSGSEMPLQPGLDDYHFEYAKFPNPPNSPFRETETLSELECYAARLNDIGLIVTLGYASCELSKLTPSSS